MAVGLGHSQGDVTLILSQRPVGVCSLNSWLSCLWQPAFLETRDGVLFLVGSTQQTPNRLPKPSI